MALSGTRMPAITLDIKNLLASLVVIGTRASNAARPANQHKGTSICAKRGRSGIGGSKGCIRDPMLGDKDWLGPCRAMGLAFMIRPPLASSRGIVLALV